MKRMSWLRRWLIIGLFMVLLLGWLVWSFVWFSPSAYTDYGPIELPRPVLTAEEYRKVQDTHPRPYIVEIETASGAILLFGASHTKDPADPQIADLKERWDRFRPTVALLEGRLGLLIRGYADPVRTFGESGFVWALARTSRVKSHTWEPPIELELQQVLRNHPREQVALFYILRPYFSNLRHGRPDNPDAMVEAFRKKRTLWPGLESTFASVAEIDATWRKDFAGLKDWRDTSDEFGLPGYLEEVWKSSNAARDEHFARVLIDLARKGQRVFAVCGSSHAVKLDPALRAALNSDSANR